MKKNILIFCNNYLGFTLLSSGGVLEDLVSAFNVTIITSKSAEKTIRKTAGPACDVIAHEPDTHPLQAAVYGFFSDILGMAYAQRDGRRNNTGRLHRAAHLKLAQKYGALERYKKAVVVSFSELGEKFWFVRKILNLMFYATAPRGEYANFIKDFKPVLAITTTAGLGRDGVFMAACHEAGVKTLALIQSWDRTASKGYPAWNPDYCIVWSDPMKFEAQTFLEIPADRVYVEGAPPWDVYLREHSPLDSDARLAFMKKWNLDITKKLAFVAINGTATHEGNLQLIRDLCEASARGELPDIQIMFRSHPAYLVDVKGTKDLEAVFAEYENPDMHLMHPIVSDPLNKDYVVTEDDRIFMHDMFRACDVTISIMSTWMIESSIFDKPNICIEYGRYVTQLYDFDLSEYTAEHITRVFSYGAVHRAKSAHDLVSLVNSVVKNPGELHKQREKLVDKETGPNKGCAREAFLRRIVSIVESL